MCVFIVSLGSPAYPRKDATHIYDGLGSFPTHVAHMRLGSFLAEPTPWPFNSSETNNNLTLYHIAVQWLKEDRDHRRELERQGYKSRGARRGVRGDIVFVLLHSLTNRFRMFQQIRRLSTRSECSICC